jgi:4'-phosphopantetheinyl transferase
MVNYKIQFLEDVPGHLDWLHPSELDLFRSFRFEKRQKDWLLGRWTAKSLLKECWYKENKLEELAILPGKNRAPFVYLDQNLLETQISISHSNGQSFCVATNDDTEIGCDLELIEKRSIAFQEDYFTLKEHELFNSVSSLITETEYYTLCWSAKEALMKATKQGMSLHPLKIELKKIEQFGNNWNTFMIYNIESSRDYFGYWKILAPMVYVVVAAFNFDLHRN